MEWKEACGSWENGSRPSYAVGAPYGVRGYKDETYDGR